MNEQLWWYVARSSGIVAMALLVLSFVWGVLLATRVFRKFDRPAWLLEVHKWLAGTAIVMVALHLLGLGLDGYIDFGWKELLVPGASPFRTTAVTIGIVSMYILVAVQATSYLRRWLPRRLWHSIHLLSYLMLWATILHAGLAGTDTASRVYQGVAIALTLLATAAALVRLVAGSNRNRAAGARPGSRPRTAKPRASGSTPDNNWGLPVLPPGSGEVAAAGSQAHPTSAS